MCEWSNLEQKIRGCLAAVWLLQAPSNRLSPAPAGDDKRKQQQTFTTTDNQSGAIWLSVFSPARSACSSEWCRRHWRCKPCLWGRAGHSPCLTLAPLCKKWPHMLPHTAFSALWWKGKRQNIQTRLSFLLRALKLLFLAREEKASVSFPKKKKKKVSFKGEKNAEMQHSSDE